MKKAILISFALAIVLLAVAACSAAAPTPTPVPLPVFVQPTALSQPAATIAPPTAAPPPSATTALPTTAPTVSATPSATTASANVTPTTAQATAVPPTIPPPSVAPTAAPASPVAPPGLYVTAMRLDPPQPTHGQAVSFYVTFLNTAATDNNQRWQVYIYKADTPTRRNNETTVLLTTFQPGSVELKALGTFTFGPTGSPCDYFYAVVDILDINNKGTDLTQPDGKTFQKALVICQ